MSKLSEAFKNVHLDGWVNELTGFGTSRDKTTYGRHVAGGLLSDQYIASLYHSSDIAARVVDVRPDEAFREGFVVSTENETIDELIANKLEDINAREHLADAMRWGRTFGGGAILIGADDKRPADVPLIPERCEDIHWLYSFDRRFIQPMSYNKDPKSHRYGQPETYMVTSANGQTMAGSRIVHASRLIVFGGATTAEQERQENGGWDLSTLQRVHDVLRQFDVGWTAVENLLTDGNQGVWSVRGLADALASGQRDYIQKRIQMADMRRSTVRAMVVDAGDGTEPAETFERQSVSFEGIPNTLDKLMLRLAAAAQTPVTILMGQSPAGMSATGESDFRWFYDSIRSEQTQKLGPLIRRGLIKTWLLTKAGQAAGSSRVKNIKISWPPLWTETPTEVATRRKMLIEADAIAIGAGVYLPDEVALHRGAQDGYDREILLDDASRKAREAALKLELEALSLGENKGASDGDAEGADAGDDVGVVDTPAGKPVDLAPTTIAKLMTANEARKMLGLPNIENGDLPIEAFAAAALAQNTPQGSPSEGSPQDPPFSGAPASSSDPSPVD